MLNAHPVALSLENRMNLTRARKSETAVILSRFLAKDLALRFFPLSCFARKREVRMAGVFLGLSG